jgi:protein-S-isoprenylcysteine O-methyltransferase Ste14
MTVNIKMQIVQFLGIFILFALDLFLPAGSMAWPADWIFLVVFFGFFGGTTLWLYRHNPALMQERMRAGAADQQGWDKVYYPLLLASFFIWLALSALDASRLHWSRVPLAFQLIGLIILLASFYLLFLTFRENAYLSSLVRVQEERGHTVVSTGPYRYVRHPMYAGILILEVGTPLLLGSWYGILLGLVPALILARRAVLEERTLKKELTGYAAYVSKVRYRLIPYIW